MALPVRRGNTPSSPTRWDPFREFEDLYTQLGQLWESAFTPFSARPAGNQLGANPWAPLADLVETDDAYLVEVDLPGVRREDLSIEVTGTSLSISGELKERERDGLLRHRTRRTGEFRYEATLPSDLDPDRITADLADGVLTVRLPKTEAAKPRQIKVTTS